MRIGPAPGRGGGHLIAVRAKYLTNPSSIIHHNYDEDVCFNQYDKRSPDQQEWQNVTSAKHDKSIAKPRNLSHQNTHPKIPSSYLGKSDGIEKLKVLRNKVSKNSNILRPKYKFKVSKKKRNNSGAMNNY